MKIDFVIPWVDGSDPEWIREKNRFIGAYDQEEIDASAARYRDWDELKYWFRGIELYAPWVNKIYFVTNGQYPSWLVKEHEKLVWIKHEDYIPKEYLPTFSANPIELNFHRIEGLSEFFVYFNDDMFLTSPTVEEDFFKHSLPCGLAIESPITPDHNDVFYHILLNNTMLLNRHFNRSDFKRNVRKKRLSLVDKRAFAMNLLFEAFQRDCFFGFEFTHLPSSFLKKTFVEVWEDNYAFLDQVCRNKFRCIHDVNQYIFFDHQYVTGNFTPYPSYKYGKAFHLEDNPGPKNNIQETCDAIRDRKYKMICVNEHHVKNFTETKRLINAAFESAFPSKSSFEK